MSDVATTAAVCVATGALSAPFCTAFGFDPTLLLGGVVGGFFGCVIVQTLIPDKQDQNFRRMLALMVGSVLLAGIATLIVSPWLIRQFNLSEVPPGAMRMAIGAVIGGFAQPLAIMLQSKVLTWFGSLGKKESGNA